MQRIGCRVYVKCSCDRPTMIGVTKLASGAGQVSLSERLEDPRVGEVSLEVSGVGICGTDLHIWAGDYPCAPPVTLGHEICGMVAEVGPGVDAAWLGKRVAVETYYSTCGACGYCRAGRRNLCSERQSLGTHVVLGYGALGCHAGDQPSRGPGVAG
jgi:L-iditol 2-dehydrogenase